MSRPTTTAPRTRQPGTQQELQHQARREIQEEVRQWLADHWDPNLDPDEWMETAVDSGWAAPSWPIEWLGRGLDPGFTSDVVAEFKSVGAFGTGQDKFNLWANTVLSSGSSELRARHLRELVLGRIQMCLLYSEPGAGSDLAAVQTRADRDGDEYVVTGQKVWTSNGKFADYAFLIARTDWNVPKHQGISFFFFPMNQEGVEVRPLRQATGDARFNEVFITEARVPATHLLGETNRGWGVLQTALAYERAWMGETQSGPPRRTASGSQVRRPKAAFTDGGAPTPDLSLLDLAADVGVRRRPSCRWASWP